MGGGGVGCALVTCLGGVVNRSYCPASRSRWVVSRVQQSQRKSLDYPVFGVGLPIVGGDMRAVANSTKHAHERGYSGATLFGQHG
jgi:hypothetical protein